MNELTEQYKAQIEALQRELKKSNTQLDEAKKLIKELYDFMQDSEVQNSDFEKESETTGL